MGSKIGRKISYVKQIHFKVSRKEFAIHSSFERYRTFSLGLEAARSI